MQELFSRRAQTHGLRLLKRCRRASPFRNWSLRSAHSLMVRAQKALALAITPHVTHRHVC